MVCQMSDGVGVMGDERVTDASLSPELLTALQKHYARTECAFLFIFRGYFR